MLRESGNAPETAVVAGASSGIGAAIADRLLASGRSVVGLARRRIEREAKHWESVQVDLSDLEALPDVATALAREHPDTEVLVLNAGKGDFGSLEEFSYQRIRDLIELNLIAHMILCRAFLPGLKRRKAGHLMFVGSEAALRGGRSGAVYCASKFGLRGFAQALRQEVSRSGVRVTSVHPGMVRTAFFDPLDFEPGEAEENAIEPEDVADAVMMAIEARPGTVVDEIELSPLKRVVKKKPAERTVQK